MIKFMIGLILLVVIVLGTIAFKKLLGDRNNWVEIAMLNEHEILKLKQQVKGLQAELERKDMRIKLLELTRGGE